MKKTLFYLTLIIIGILCTGVVKYIHSKTVGYGISSCMIDYVNEHYPKGCTYMIEGKFPHIDKCGMENELMELTGEVNGCFVGGGALSSVFNTPYCFITLTFEKILGKIY